MTNPQLQIDLLKILCNNKDLQIEILSNRILAMQKREAFLMEQCERFKEMLAKKRELFDGQSVLVSPLEVE